MFAQVLATEFLELRRCKVTWFSPAALSIGPLGIALMWIVRAPEGAARFGLVGTKANLAGLEATWPAYASARATRRVGPASWPRSSECRPPSPERQSSTS